MHRLQADAPAKSDQTARWRGEPGDVMSLMLAGDAVALAYLTS